ncbi:unnamed protein product [Parajaminaea phylloscopi]
MVRPTQLALKFRGVYREARDNWRIYLLAAGMAFAAMMNGWDVGLIGGVLVTPSFQTAFGLLSDKASAYHRLAELKGNIVSVLQAGCFVGAVTALYLPARFGHRRTLIFSAVVFTVGSIIQTCCLLGYVPGQATTSSAGLRQLYVGRFIGGYGVGLSSAAGPSYLVEISPAKIRGRVTGCWQFFGLSGIMLAFFANYGVSRAGYAPLAIQHWRIPFALQLIPGLVFLVSAVISPESPRWLFEQRQDEAAARRSLAFLYGCGPKDAPVEEVMAEIRRDIALSSVNNALFLYRQEQRAPTKTASPDAAQSSLPHLTDGHVGARIRWGAILSHPMTLYRMAIPAILFMYQQLTGTNSLNYYSPTIFRSLGVHNDLLATGLIGVVKVVTSLLANLFAYEQIGRKWSLILSGTGQSLCLFWIGIYLRFRPPTVQQTQQNVGQPTYLDGAATLTVIILFLYVAWYSVGWTGVPWLAGNELAPTHTQLRSVATAIGQMSNWIFQVIIAKVTPLMLESLKYGTFLFFACTMLSGVVWAILFMPEPVGWPLEQMDALFEHGTLVERSLADLSPRKRQQFREEQLAEATQHKDSDQLDKGA